MKIFLLKVGLVLLFSTLFINCHIEESEYYSISKIQNYDYDELSLKEENAYKSIPKNIFLSKEQYCNFLYAQTGYVQTLILKSTIIKTKPFEKTRSVLFTLILIISSVLIVLGINFKTINKTTTLTLIVFACFPISYQFFESSQFKEPLNKRFNLVEIGDNLNNLKKNTNYIEGRVSDLEGRISELE